MATNDERRGVAERLRELSKFVYHPGNTYELMIEALGVEDVDGTDDLFSRLADLIEPDQDHNVDPDKKVDLDALLSMADEMEEFAQDLDEHFDTCEPAEIFDWLRRIRKACGEEGR